MTMTCTKKANVTTFNLKWLYRQHQFYYLTKHLIRRPLSTLRLNYFNPFAAGTEYIRFQAIFRPIYFFIWSWKLR